MSKEQELKTYLEEADRLVDGLGLGIDDGIKRSVAIMRMEGFSTSGSCEGHSDWAYPYPWIEIDDNEPRVEFDDSIQDYEERLKAKKVILRGKDPTENNLQREKLEKLLERYQSSGVKIRRYGSGFRLVGVGSTLAEAQQAMSSFTEWLLNE